MRNLTQNQKFLTLLTVLVFGLTLLAVPVAETNESSASYGRQDWIGIWEIEPGGDLRPEWKLLGLEWLGLGIGYAFFFKLFGTERREAAPTSDWLKRAARERKERRRERDA